MKTQAPSLPRPLPTAEMALGDEVVFHYTSPDGLPASINAPLPMGLLFAANAMRSDEPFSLGYPGDRIGRLARREGAQIVLHPDVSETFNRMVAFLDDFTAAIIERVREADVQAEESEPAPTSAPAASTDAGNNSPAAA